MVPEATLDDTETGRLAAGKGWFVLNARDARWRTRPGRRASRSPALTEFEAETYFPQLGVNLLMLEPGVPNAMYHWETEQEAFFVLAGEALLIVEGQERPVGQWDFVHCPPETRHVFVGAGDGPCWILAMSSREFQAAGPWGAYVADEVARRYGASVEEDTQDADVAYARCPAPRSRRAIATAGCPAAEPAGRRPRIRAALRGRC